MSLIGNIVRYPSMVLLTEGFKADTRKLDGANCALQKEIKNLKTSKSELIGLIKEELPDRLKPLSNPLASVFLFFAKRTFLEIGGLFGAVLGALGFAYSSSPAAWLRTKIRNLSDSIYEKTRPLFTWGGAILGISGLTSLCAGYLLKVKSKD